MYFCETFQYFNSVPLLCFVILSPDVGAAEDRENLMLSSGPIQEQEANQEMRKENCLRVSTETPMSTDQEDQLPSLEATAVGFVYPEISESVSNINNNCRPKQMNSAIGSCGNSVMVDDPVSHNSTLNPDCVVASSITSSICLPSDISSSPSLVSEAVASNDCPTLTATSSATYPATMTPSDVHLYCPTSEETAMASQVSVASAVALDCTTASMSATESHFCTEESAATDATSSLEQPSGWALYGTKTPVIPVAEKADSGKFIGMYTRHSFRYLTFLCSIYRKHVQCVYDRFRKRTDKSLTL